MKLHKNNQIILTEEQLEILDEFRNLIDTKYNLTEKQKKVNLDIKFITLVCF